MNKQMMVLMGCVFAMGRLDLDSRIGIEMLRLGFLVSGMYCSVAYWWIYAVVGQKKDQTLIEIRPAQDNQPAVTQTKHDYDMERLSEMIRSYVMWIFMVGVMHFQMQAVRPLFLTLMLNPTTATENSLFKIHILGLDDELPDIRRPFPPDSFLANLGLNKPPPPLHQKRSTIKHKGEASGKVGQPSSAGGPNSSAAQ